MWDSVGQKFGTAHGEIQMAFDSCLTDINQIHNDLKGENAYNKFVNNTSNLVISIILFKPRLKKN